MLNTLMAEGGGQYWKPIAYRYDAQYINNITAVRFAGLGFRDSPDHIRRLDDSFLAPI
jgi:hypothetical protein